jgi:MFS family permease
VNAGAVETTETLLPSPTRPWRILASGPFRSLWTAHLLALLGESFSYVAMPWLVLQITGSALAVGTVLALQAVPRAVLMIVGGAVADRVSPRLAMVGSAATRAVGIGALAALILTRQVQLWEVYIAALAVGVVSAFFLPARFAVLPTVIHDHELEAGNALLNLNQQGSMFLGPALAGVLIATTNTGAAFGVDAAAFAVATLLLLSVQTRGRPASADLAPASAPPTAGLLREMADGVAYTWNDVALRSIIALIAVVDFCYAGAIQVGLPVLAQQRFSEGAAAFGSVVAGFGVGSTIGVLGAGLKKVPPRFGLLVIAVVAWLGIGLGLIGLAPTLPAAILAAAATGMGTGVVNTFGITWLQRRTPEVMRGRVMALLLMASFGSAPISLALAGLLAARHAALLFGVGALMILGAALVGGLSRTVRSM